ncbi:MAG TPA: hypothetical protein VL199_18125 [Burkholderiales bacterium]|jgi:hypothetical protein|nr:hypothetical protein [Burkholderiales bacterium]
MRALLLLPVVLLAACASTSPKDLEKMSTIDVCYEGMMDPDKKAMVDAELTRRQENCDKYAEKLKEMARQEARAGGPGAQGTDAAKSSGYGGAPSGGMGRY